MMAQINFGLLNTNAPYEIGTSFQRGMDEAMLRKQAMDKFETDKQQRAITNQYNQQQQELLRMNYQNDADKIRQHGIDRDLKRKQESAELKFYLPKLLKAAGYNVPSEGIGLDEETGQFIGADGKPMDDSMFQVSATQPTPGQDELRELIAYGMQDPKLRGQAFKKAIELTQGGKAPKQPTLGFDDYAIMRELGVIDPYNMTAEQAAKYRAKRNEGKKPLVDMSGASFGGNASLPDMGEAQKTAGKEFGKFAQNAVEGAQSAYDVANDVEMVVEGLRGMGGGPVAEFKAWAGRVMPAGTDWANMASMNDLAKTVQVKLAPTMRAAGSGATSDFEMKSFMAAIPSLSSTEQGRLLMSKYAKRVADRAQARAEVVNDIEQEGRLPTPKEIAQRMEAKVGKSFFDAADRAYFGIKGSAAPASQLAPQPSAKTSQTAFDNMPMPQKYTGKILRDSVSGKRYQSDGKNWKEVK